MEFVSAEKLSEIFGIKEKTFYMWARSRKIPSYKVGRLVRFKVEEVRAWVERGKVQPLDFPDLSRSSGLSADKLVEGAIESVLGKGYNRPKRGIKPNRGLGKKVTDGTL